MQYVTLKSIIVEALALSILLFTLFAPQSALAQNNNLSLSVTPPFFQMTITPGETWSSFIKLVNVNDFPIILYASVVNFESNNNEVGRGKFTPLLSQEPEYKAASLAGWIDVTGDAIHIAPGDTVKLPFSINPPKNASPGGHYAAILIGNQPVLGKDSGSAIAVSSLISSLIFARVAGDADERGDIREFSTDSLFYEVPEVEFDIRFENTGNVHLLPQGDIAIFNMWGRKRGVIPVNQKTAFGNVLPESVRKFSFSWKGESSPLEIGRYKAVATLTFGSKSRQNSSSITSFWVVPLVPVASILGTILLLGLLISWFIRRYIRRALGVEAERLRSPVSHQPTVKILAQPLVDGVMDLRKIARKEEEIEKRLSFFEYLHKYRLFFLFIGVLIAGIFVVKAFFGEVLVPERGYEIKVDSDISVPFSNE